MMKFVTDDHTAIDVAIQFGIREGMMSECLSKDGHYHDIDQSKANRIINVAVREGLLKLHMELGEAYYHPTTKGLESLDSQSSTNNNTHRVTESKN